MRLYWIGVWTLSIILVLLSAILLFYASYIIEETAVFSADVYISKEKVGFNLDSDKIHFGIVKKGGSSSLRFLEIENKRTYPVEIIIKSKGEIEDWVYCYLKNIPETIQKTFILEPEEKVELVIGLIPGEEAEIGKKYTGEIKIITKKVSFCS